MENGAVLPLFYLPNIEYFKNLSDYKENLLLEDKEHYPKQTFRNRTYISGANGKLSLTVPVQKPSNKYTVYRDIRISYDEDWQRIHWLSLEASYRSSSYFEFYEDIFKPFYTQKFEFLLDYNEQMLNALTKILKLKVSYNFVDEYHKEYTDRVDFRTSLSLKKETGYKNKPYFQVFDDRNETHNNISVIDLIFSVGPQASKYF
jgi:hypothetical protein